MLALTGLPIGYSVIVSLTGLPIGYSVIVALTGLPIGYSVLVLQTGLSSYKNNGAFPLLGIATFGTPGSGAPGSVLMLYGLDINRISCDSIFNLLCSYGNILKVL